VRRQQRVSQTLLVAIATNENCRQLPLSVGLPAEAIMVKFRLLLISLLVLAVIPAASGQFAHTDHKQIVDATGKPLLTRATNIGNCLVPEGYRRLELWNRLQFLER